MIAPASDTDSPDDNSSDPTQANEDSEIADAAFLEARFWHEAGLPRARPVGDASVRYVLLDSSPSAGDPAVPGHGAAMQQLASHALCPPDAESCFADLHHRAALPIRATGDGAPAWSIANGGDIGTMGWLAQAVRREVIAWQTTASTQALVLNLSLGWNPIDAGSTTNQAELSVTDPRTFAVWSALRDAQCRGALTFAAAGNRAAVCEPDGSGRCDGPLLPAAWGASAEPTEVGELRMSCEAFLGPEPVGQEVLPDESDPTNTVHGPLLYAVGAVGPGGSLALSRPGSTPWLRAWGDHAPVTLDRPRYISGTSVSTVVVSAAAAARWQTSGAGPLPPTPGALSLMRALYGTGTDSVEPNLDAYHAEDEPSPFGEASEKSRIIRGCAVLPGESCDAAGPASPGPDTTAPPVGDAPPHSYPCPTGITTWGLEATDDVCALDIALSAADHGWLVPQPPETDCDLCNIRPSFEIPELPDTMYIRIRYSGALAAGDLDTDLDITATAYLRVQTNNQVREVGFALPLDKAKLGTAQLFQLTAPTNLNLTSNDQLEAAALVTVVDAPGRPPFSFLTELVRY